MKVVIQRVKNASVSTDSTVLGKIGAGLLVLLGIEESDNLEDIEWLCAKIVRLRIFDDSKGVMNLSLKEANGDILLVSQFTLHASTKKGNRPSYINAAKPDIAIPIYKQFKEHLEMELSKPVQEGEFGANMQVTLTNDGPVTIIIDSKNKQ